MIFWRAGGKRCLAKEKRGLLALRQHCTYHLTEYRTKVWCPRNSHSQKTPQAQVVEQAQLDPCTRECMKVINILWRSVAQSNRTSQISSHLTGPMTLVHNAPQNVNHFHAPPSTPNQSLRSAAKKSNPWWKL